MRTTIHLDDDLASEIKQLAAQRRTTLRALIEESLRESLARRRRHMKTAPTRLTTVKGHGTLPGIDLDDTTSLLDILDQGDDPA